MRKTIASLGSAALILLALPSQLMAETLPIEGVYPAGNDKLATLSTLAMSPFGGADGEALSIDLEQKLRDVTIRGNSYFNILASRGRGGVDGIISGTANGRSESRHELGQRQECVYRNAKGNCKETRWVKINCTRRIVTLNYTLGVEGSRRERIFAITKTAVNSELICPDSGEVAPVDVVVGQLVSGVANELRMQFAPAEIRENIRVKEGVEGLQGNAKSKFKDAIKLTKRNVTSACNVWTEVDQLVPNHSPTLFNLGLCAESRRDYNGAEALYKRVADLNRSETYAVEAIARINRHRHAERQIAAQATKTRK